MVNDMKTKEEKTPSVTEKVLLVIAFIATIAGLGGWIGYDIGFKKGYLKGMIDDTEAWKESLRMADMLVD